MTLENKEGLEGLLYYKDLLEGLNSNESKLKSNKSEESTSARRYIANVIGTIHNNPGILDPISDMDSRFNHYIPSAKETLEQLAKEKFTKDKDKIISEAKEKHASNFASYYFIVKPKEIEGDEEHNKVARLHSAAYSLQEFLEKTPDSNNIREYASFIQKATGILIKTSIEELMANGISKEQAEKLAKVYGAAFASISKTEPTRAYQQVAIVIQNTMEKLENMLPEEEKEDYVEKNLRALDDKSSLEYVYLLANLSERDDRSSKKIVQFPQNRAA